VLLKSSNSTKVLSIDLFVARKSQIPAHCAGVKWRWFEYFKHNHKSRFPRLTVGCACDCEASCGAAMIGGDKDEAETIVAGQMFSLPGMGCSPQTMPMLGPALA
jgi:hypothetical protein